MTRLQRALTCIPLAGVLCACGTVRPPQDYNDPRGEEFRNSIGAVSLELSQIGGPIDSVNKDLSRVVVRSDEGGRGACTNPPRPNNPRAVNIESLRLALAAVALINENHEAGKETIIDKCRPTDDQKSASTTPR